MNHEPLPTPINLRLGTHMAHIPARQPKAVKLLSLKTFIILLRTSSRRTRSTNRLDAGHRRNPSLRRPRLGVPIGVDDDFFGVHHDVFVAFIQQAHRVTTAA